MPLAWFHEVQGILWPEHDTPMKLHSIWGLQVVNNLL